jgi:NAD(P) transhydrogenase subunit alpha
VEFNAGIAAGFSNEDYIHAGAIVTESKTLLYQNATMVTWVKPPQNILDELLKMPKKILIIGFTNPFKKQSVHHLAEELGIKLLSLELLPHQQTIHPEIDALASMSRFAGQIALKEAFQLSDKQSHIVLVIGAGQSGMAAAQIVNETNNKLIVVSTSERTKIKVEQLLKGTFIKLPNEEITTDTESVLKQQQTIIKERILHYQPNIVITTARRPGQLAPNLLPNETLDSLPRNSVVMDLTASVGGNTAITVFNKNVCTANGVWVCNKSNYPSAEAKQASIAYATCLAEIIKSIICNEFKIMPSIAKTTNANYE